MTGATIRGVVGQIKWKYHNAAAINSYAVTRSKDGQWSLRATVVMSDAYRLTQRPLVFVAPHRQHDRPGEWRWPILDFSIAAGALTARLGPPEP
jgi:hypothetical protein